MDALKKEHISYEICPGVSSFCGAAAALEAELLDAINRMPIGPGGLGGTRTCLGVRLLLRPCHIASLPVAVNIQCNAARRGEICL